MSALVSIKEATSTLGVSRTTVHRLIQERKLLSVQIRGRRLIKAESLRSLVESAR